VEWLAAPVEVPLPKFELDARFGLFVRPARPTPEHRRHCYDNRKWREFATVKDCAHAFLVPGWIVKVRPSVVSGFIPNMRRIFIHVARH
jgi:hypothetical protein